MKWLSGPILLCLFLASGCAHGIDAVSSPELGAAPVRHGEGIAPAPERVQVDTVVAPSPAGSRSGADGSTTAKEGTAKASGPTVASGIPAKPESADDAYADYTEEGGEQQEKARIADPLEPFNRAMYHFNDKLYFWVLKPVAQGYKAIVPEFARIGVGNFFTNIAFPIRFVNCLLQANFKGAGREVGRFVVNSLAGVGGFLDPASREDVGLAKQDEDFGQTLGVYGVGQGIFINWPILGPSSPRDTLGMIGDYFLYPLTYYTGPWLIPWELRAFEKVNDTSLRIGDYESLKEAAIDPYVAIRDAYVQYRLNKVKER